MLLRSLAGGRPGCAGFGFGFGGADVRVEGRGEVSADGSAEGSGVGGSTAGSVAVAETIGGRSLRPGGSGIPSPATGWTPVTLGAPARFMTISAPPPSPATAKRAAMARIVIIVPRDAPGCGGGGGVPDIGLGGSACVSLQATEVPPWPPATWMRADDEGAGTPGDPTPRGVDGADAGSERPD